MNMQNALDPDRMTVEQRGREVAAFLALGLVRLRMALEIGREMLVDEGVAA
jgi:hypothetical protein